MSKNWVYLIFLCRKEPGDPCYLQESLPLHSRCIFLRVEVWDTTSREFKVSAFQRGWSPLRSSARSGVAGVCVFNLCNSSVSLGPPSSVCQLAGITFPALPVPFLACYANDLMTNAFWRWGEGGAEGKETPDFIPIPRCVWISLSQFLTFFSPTAHKHKVGLMPTILNSHLQKIHRKLRKPTWSADPHLIDFTLKKKLKKTQACTGTCTFFSHNDSTYFHMFVCKITGGRMGITFHCSKIRNMTINSRLQL